MALGDAKMNKPFFKNPLACRVLVACRQSAGMSGMENDPPLSLVHATHATHATHAGSLKDQFIFMGGDIQQPPKNGGLAA